MAHKSEGTVLSKNEILETQIKFNLDLGREIAWHLLSVPIQDISLNQFNNRFAPDEALSEEEHEKAIIEEDAIAFENLQKSWESNPQFEQLIGFTDKSSEKVNLIAGHRRYFAAKRANAETALVWIAESLSPEEIELVRDWPEIHQTKVVHSTYSRYKSIYNDLKGRNEIDRERRINIWKQKGYTKKQILKAERTFGRLESFCKSNNEKTHNRSGQIKAFETYDQICETKFEEMKDRGDIERLVNLQKVANSFLKNQIAHDDLKVTIEGLSELPASDPVYKAINDNPEYLDNIANLRRLTNLARSNKNSIDVVGDIKDFTARIFAKLIDRADTQEIEESLSEFRDTVSRLESALNNIQKGGE